MIEAVVIPGSISIPFRYSAGRTASRFFVELRDHRRIMGTRCPACGRVLVPARSFCAACSVETDRWIEVGPEGTLVTWTTVHLPLPHLPVPPPCTLGLIRLDGADTDFLHLIGGDERALRVGERLRAVWGERRSGSLLDLAYFAPIVGSRVNSAP
ncbi:MAG: Zn-ribbon domain-containing OB-fold protein [Candidatus Methylomirabilia bacterium]